MLTVTPIAAFNDNYIWLIQPQNSSQVYIVDPGDADPVIHFLEKHQLTIAGILVTHHHWDHVNGIKALISWSKNEFPVYGPDYENIPYVTHGISNEQEIHLININLKAKVIYTPGHTLGHICYLINDCLFCGDTLFSGGCGRLFEGSPEQMLNSLQLLSQLDINTKVYCAHEYTQANLSFALTVEPNNQDLIDYNNWAENQRNATKPTLPSTIGLERKINPFLRSDTPFISNKLNLSLSKQNNNTVSRFALLRQWKDNF